jgi:hypothetical protein
MHHHNKYKIVDWQSRIYTSRVNTGKHLNKKRKIPADLSAGILGTVYENVNQALRLNPPS